MTTPRYLIWDFDGTLAIRPGEWSGAICELLRDAFPELPVDRERIRPCMRVGFPWHMPERVRDPCSEDGWWAAILPLIESAMVEGAGVSVDDARILVERFRRHYTDPAYWTVYDDVVPVLWELRDHGWRHLLLSNHVPELRRLVTALGLEPYFTSIFCSAELGVEKPNPQAFERVFADYPEARAGWMIGDSWTADVEGARGVGLRSILVRRRHPEAELHCETLRGVVDVVSAV